MQELPQRQDISITIWPIWPFFNTFAFREFINTGVTECFRASHSKNRTRLCLCQVGGQIIYHCLTLWKLKQTELGVLGMFLASSDSIHLRNNCLSAPYWEKTSPFWKCSIVWRDLFGFSYVMNGSGEICAEKIMSA